MCIAEKRLCARRNVALHTTLYRLPKPDECPENVYSFMLNCWAAEPTERPTFDDALRMIKPDVEARSPSMEVDGQSRRTLQTTTGFSGVSVVLFGPGSFTPSLVFVLTRVFVERPVLNPNSCGSNRRTGHGRFSRAAAPRIRVSEHDYMAPFPRLASDRDSAASGASATEAM